MGCQKEGDPGRAWTERTGAERVYPGAPAGNVQLGQIRDMGVMPKTLHFDASAVKPA